MPPRPALALGPELDPWLELFPEPLDTLPRPELSEASLSKWPLPYLPVTWLLPLAEVIVVSPDGFAWWWARLTT